MSTELRHVSVLIEQSGGGFTVTVDPDNLVVRVPSTILWQITEVPPGVTATFVGVNGLPNPPFGNPIVAGTSLTVADSPLEGTIIYPYMLELTISPAGLSAPFGIKVDPQITNTSD